MPIIYLAIFAIFLFQNLAISAFTTYYYSLTLSLGDMPIRPLCLLHNYALFVGKSTVVCQDWKRNAWTDTEIHSLPAGLLWHIIITKSRMMSAVLMMTMTKTMTLTVAYHYHPDHGDQRGFGTGCDWCGHVGTPTRWSSNTNIRTNTNTNGNISTNTNTNTITITIHRDHGNQRGVGTGCDWCGHLGTPTENLYSTSVNNFENSIKYPCLYFLLFGAHAIQLVIHFYKIS